MSKKDILLTSEGFLELEEELNEKNMYSESQPSVWDIVGTQLL